jgi:hypothetical protein
MVLILQKEAKMEECSLKVVKKYSIRGYDYFMIFATDVLDLKHLCLVLAPDGSNPFTQSKCKFSFSTPLPRGRYNQHFPQIKDITMKLQDYSVQQAGMSLDHTQTKIHSCPLKEAIDNMTEKT